jgi:hypothetical protein
MESVLLVWGTRSRARRAALIADYANKIAQPLRNLAPEEVEAALDGLRSERDAVLASLRLLKPRAQKDQSRPRSSERYLHQKGTRRLRFRKQLKAI